MSNHNIGTPRPELGEYTFALPVERHMVYFLQTDTEIVALLQIVGGDKLIIPFC
ncbi:TPA: type II toxin-antitoxin system RelE/ParE family toxin [Escherichia coli]|nr:type II toxin-antitoxin system RelE/ParE family toxin [Escherichia coli]